MTYSSLLIILPAYICCWASLVILFHFTYYSFQLQNLSLDFFNNLFSLLIFSGEILSYFKFLDMISFGSLNVFITANLKCLSMKFSVRLLQSFLFFVLLFFPLYMLYFPVCISYHFVFSKVELLTSIRWQFWNSNAPFP